MKKNEPIITFLDKKIKDEPWEHFIMCQCHGCGEDFELDTEDLDLDDDEPLVQCDCGNESRLRMIVRK